MTITLTREEAQQVLDALEKLANETPTTHVRIGKAISEGKEHVALWFDDSTDPLQQALYLNATKPEKLKPLLAFFRARLSAPEPEPVAWADKRDIEREGHDFYVNRQQPAKDGVPLYTQRKEWQSLTDEECLQNPYCAGESDVEVIQLARAIEQVLREKNT